MTNYENEIDGFTRWKYSLVDPINIIFISIYDLPQIAVLGDTSKYNWAIMNIHNFRGKPSQWNRITISVYVIVILLSNSGIESLLVST